MKNIFRIAVLITLMAGGFAQSVAAGPITITSDSASATEGFATFSGTLAYDPATAKLTIQLANTSSLMGYLTGLAFKAPAGLITGVSLASSASAFGLIGGPSFSEGIIGSPFGRFDIGASTSSTWLGGGPSTGGIQSGSFATFTFAFTGIGLGGLTEQDFVSAGGSGEFFVARFRGFDEPLTAGSDKVPADVVADTVPEPVSLLLLGCGFIGLRRRLLAHTK